MIFIYYSIELWKEAFEKVTVNAENEYSQMIYKKRKEMSSTEYSKHFLIADQIQMNDLIHNDI